MFKSSLLVFLTITLVALSCADEYLAEKPDWLPSCKIYEPGFVNCSTHSIQQLFLQMRTGISGLTTISKIDPLQINKIKINQGGNAAVNIKVELSKVMVGGFGDARVKESRVSKKDFSWQTKFVLPKMRLDANYVLQGRILLIPLNGNGKLFLEAENMDVIMHTKTQLYEKHGYTFYNVTSAKIDYTITGFRCKLDNLFNGNKELEDSTNKFFNDNWEPVAEALKPVIQQTVEEILVDIMGKIFHYIPASFFVSDIPTSTKLYG